MPKQPEVPSDPTLAELVAIKKLLVLKLFRDGVTQSQVATVLGVSQSQISRMFPKGLPPSGKK